MKLPSGWIFIPRTKDGITVQVEEKELICCRDCENWQTDWIARGGGHYCGMIDLETEGDFYCGYAERRTDE